MAKLTAWLVTIIGILAILALIMPNSGLGTLGTGVLGWIVAILVLIVGIGKLVRNYSRKRK